MHHILVAEDSSVLRLILERTFRLAGFSVSTAVDGLDAWEQAEQNDFSLVVTDQQMPRMSGSELCERLRQSERLSETPVIMITAKAYELDQQQLRDELGVVAVFVKPFSPTKVLHAAQHYLSTPSPTH
ncbi:MAG: response regulator [Planctomycetota bacterium]